MWAALTTVVPGYGSGLFGGGGTAADVEDDAWEAPLGVDVGGFPRSGSRCAGGAGGPPSACLGCGLGSGYRHWEVVFLECRGGGDVGGRDGFSLL